MLHGEEFGLGDAFDHHLPELIYVFVLCVTLPKMLELFISGLDSGQEDDGAL
jgi:hypothetical protein